MENCLKIQALDLLEEQIRRYTMGDSTSVTYETAEELSESIWFCVGKGLPEGKEPDIRSLFYSGRKRISEEFQYGKRLYGAAVESRVDCGNISYDDTYDGIACFFKGYDIYFFAHDVPCMIDYQLFKPVKGNLKGIDFINAYLGHLIYENLFCGLFEKNRLIAMLEAFPGSYKEDLVNIFGLVFNNAMALAAIGKDPARLIMTEQDMALLMNMLKDKTSGEIGFLFQNALGKIKLSPEGFSGISYSYYAGALVELVTRITTIGPDGISGMFTHL